MRHGKLLIASGAIAAGLAIVAAAAYRRLPAGTRLPTHWGANGLPDRFADAGAALAAPAAMTVGIALIMTVLPLIEPLQHRLERSAPLFRTTWGIMLAFLVLVEAVVAAPAFGIVLPSTIMLVAQGILLIGIGNVLPKSRPSFFVGIRTPWAIVDADNWIATHRLGGRVMTGAGVLVLALALVPMSASLRTVAMIAILAVVVTVPVIYSFLLWRRSHVGYA